MIDERFAITHFKNLGLKTPEAEALNKQLAAEIAAELHRAIEPAFRTIADRLRSLGHTITEVPPEYDPEFQAWDYEHRDPADDQAVRIWFHTQVGAICGYIEPHNETEKT